MIETREKDDFRSVKREINIERWGLRKRNDQRRNETEGEVHWTDEDSERETHEHRRDQEIEGEMIL